jgi:prepilin-type N-terminal cleavage/methylation domain-containing protein
MLKKQGFTLVELVVVIAIIAVLSSVVAPNVFKSIEKARKARAIKDLQSLNIGVAALYVDTGKFPNGCPISSANPEVALDTPASGLFSRPVVGVVEGPCEWTVDAVARWDGPYMSNHGGGTDPWGTTYIYDPDYAFCNAGAYPVASCPSDTSRFLLETCRSACRGALNCAPPMLISNGPDKMTYTCDDVILSPPAQ